MGDVRYERDLQKIKEAPRPVDAIHALADDAVIHALAASSRGSDPYLANVLATEALNRLRRSRIIASHIGEGVYTIDAEGTFTSVNPAAERLLGWSETELLGQPAMETLRVRAADGSEIPQDRGPAARVLIGDTIERNDVFVTCGDGRLIPIAYVAAPIPGDGSPEGAVVAFRDITERRRAEARRRFLTQGTELLGATLDPGIILRNVAQVAVPAIAAWCAVDVVDEEGAVHRVAAECSPEARAVASTLERRLAPDARSGDGVGRVLRTGRPDTLEPCGGWTALVVPLASPERMLGTVALATPASKPFDPADVDVAVEFARRAAMALDRARLHEDLRRNEERYRSIVQHNPDAVFAMDAETRFLEVNAAAESLVGFTREELLGRSFAPLVAPEDLDEAFVRFQKVMSGEPDRHEYTLVRKDGTRRRVDVTGVPMTNDGKVVGVYGLAKDITGRERR